MPPHRRLGGVVLVCALAVACTSRQVDGAAQYSAGPGGAPTATASPGPSGGTPTDTGGLPTRTGTGIPAPLPTLAGVCGRFDPAALRRAFGAPVTVRRVGDDSCQLSTVPDGDTLVVARYATYTLNDFKSPRGHPTGLTVGGHPAIRTDQAVLYVATTADASRRGVLAAFYVGLSRGSTIATAVLAHLLSRL